MQKTVAAEWIYIEDNPPNKRVMCLCEDGKIRFGNPVCGDGYFYLQVKEDSTRQSGWR